MLHREGQPNRKRKTGVAGFYPRDGGAAAVWARESAHRPPLCGAIDTNRGFAAQLCARLRARLRARLAAIAARIGRCPLCEAATGDAVCGGCLVDLAANGPVCCPRCAHPELSPGICRLCESLPPQFDAAFAALDYGDSARDLIGAFKFGKQWRLGGALADLTAGYFRGAAAALAEARPGARAVLIPIPLHPLREMTRGFNQALEWARNLRRPAFAAGPRSILAPQLLRRARPTQPQARLVDLRTRIQNVRGAFVVDPGARAKIERWREESIFVLLDDVITTGATMNEAAKTLRQAGARDVVAWSVARTRRAGAVSP